MSKSTKSDKFLKLIEKHKGREKTEKFSGSMEEYLKLVEKDAFNEDYFLKLIMKPL